MIDTLILSGGGPSGIAYAGILKALTDHNILKRDDLNEIITTSVGIIFSILYLLDYNNDQIEKISLETMSSRPNSSKGPPIFFSSVTLSNFSRLKDFVFLKMFSKNEIL